MKAIVRREYGPPDVLSLEEVPTPTPGNDEVLVRIHAAALNPADGYVLRGEPFFMRLGFGGLLKPASRIPGADIAGRVEEVGGDVTELEPGDEVFGDLSASGFGAFAEYVCVEEGTVAPKPAGITFDEAAAVPLAATAALQGLRDLGGIGAGQEVLVNGASGGVGTFAVQIAKSFGATVTGVCSTRNVEMVRSLGADRVVDYTREDFTRDEGRYDLILDAAAYRPISEHRRALGPEGTYILVGGDTGRMFRVMLLGPLLSLFGSRTFAFLFSRPDRDDLLVLKELIEEEKVSPVIDRRFPLDEVPEAIRYLEEGHTQGKVVIAIEGSTPPLR